MRKKIAVLLAIIMIFTLIPQSLSIVYAEDTLQLQSEMQLTVDELSADEAEDQCYSDELLDNSVDGTDGCFTPEEDPSVSSQEIGDQSYEETIKVEPDDNTPADTVGSDHDAFLREDNGCSYTEETDNISSNNNYKIFATVDDLKSKYRLDGTEGTNKQLVYFGKNGSNARRWYIAGFDKNDPNKSLVLICDPTEENFFGYEMFNDTVGEKDYSSDWNCNYQINEPTGGKVYANHWAGSILRSKMQNLLVGTDNFSVAEKKLMNSTTITSYDTKADCSYTTTETLYAAYANKDTPNNTYVTVGKNDAGSGAYGPNNGICVNLSGVNGLTEGPGFWTRTANATINTRALIGCPNSYTGGGIIASDDVYSADLDYYDVREGVVPVFGLKLGSVLFASAAPTAKVLNTDLDVSTPFAFRFDGSSNILSTATCTSNTIEVNKQSGETGNIFLYVLYNDGSKDKVYSKQITGNCVLTSADLGIDSMSNTRVWLEKTDDNVTYAKYADTLPVDEVRLGKDTENIEVGKTKTLIAYVTPSNATNNNITWKSDDTSIAAVSDTGIVTGKKAGTTTITATASDGSGKSATCIVTVTQPVTGITINKTSLSLKVGNTFTLLATVIPSDATNKKLTWKSNDTSIAAVSDTGIVTGKKAGTTTITATASDGSGKSATCIVTVTQPATGITIDKASINSVTYNGKEQVPTVTYNGKTLTVNTDYTWEKADTRKVYKNAGTYEVVLTGKGNYTGTSKKKFTITAKAITPIVTLAKKEYTYNGKAKKPAVTVKDGNTKLASSDYTVSYVSGRKNVGAYKVTVTLKGNYSGKKTASFKILPQGTSLNKPEAKKKAITVSWKKQTAKMSKSRITGYEIQVATDKNFTKNKKTVTAKGYKTTSKKITKLKGGKKYFVRIRTYMTLSGKEYCSLWSEAVSAKTKK